MTLLRTAIFWALPLLVCCTTVNGQQTPADSADLDENNDVMAQNTEPPQTPKQPVKSVENSDRRNKNEVLVSRIMTHTCEGSTEPLQILHIDWAQKNSVWQTGDQLVYRGTIDDSPNGPLLGTKKWLVHASPIEQTDPTLTCLDSKTYKGIATHLRHNPACKILHFKGVHFSAAQLPMGALVVEHFFVARQADPPLQNGALVKVTVHGIYPPYHVPIDRQEDTVYDISWVPSIKTGNLRYDQCGLSGMAGLIQETHPPVVGQVIDIRWFSGPKEYSGGPSSVHSSTKLNEPTR